MKFSTAEVIGDIRTSSVTERDEVCAEGRRPSVLFLNRSYWPDVEATGQLLTSLCEGLARDFEVSVLAGRPNSVIDPPERQDWRTATERNGVRIHRVAHTTFSKRSVFGKGLNFLSFARAAHDSLRTFATPEVVVFETDPFLLAFTANRLQRRTQCRMVGYLQDVYPDVAVAMGKVRNSWLIRRLRNSLFEIYHQCDRMVVLSQDMAELLTEGGIRSDRISIVPNWADTQSIAPVSGENRFRLDHRLGDRFIAMYSGNLGQTQRLEEFLQAAELLKDRTEILFCFVGRGSEERQLRRHVQTRGLTNVRFFDYQPQSELVHSLTAADLHLVPLTKALSRCLMPSKIYGILAAGRPYLTNAPCGSELHAISTSHKVGLTVEPGSVQGIADQIRWAAHHPSELAVMGRNARQLAESRYTQQHSLTQFRNILQEVLA